MCGITGFIDILHRKGDDELQNICRQMTDTVRHRGPDDSGILVDAEAGVAFGHRRLSIIDLSSGGHQPMSSQSGRYVISYNGEVYNYKDLRCELQNSGYVFRGGSDTEIMLAAIDQWGFKNALARFNCMFAFSLLDRRNRTLFLVRDRLGIKPLYYGLVGNDFVFASELKAIKSHPGFNNEIDRDSVALMMSYSYIPAPRSIYKNINKLLPGRMIEINIDELRKNNDCHNLSKIRPHTYWSVSDTARNGILEPLNESEEQTLERFDFLLRDSVKLRMISDVPLGVFLSGGIDSTIITALMQAQSSAKVKTFSIGFSEEQYNEAVYASEIANYLGTEHTELYASPNDAIALIPEMPKLYDEPFADDSQIPTFLVSKLARKHVTVCLSGDGGDEIFGGYNRYVRWNHIPVIMKKYPAFTRRALQIVVETIPPHLWNRFFAGVGTFIPEKYHYRQPGEKFHKFVKIINSSSRDEMHMLLASSWLGTDKVVINNSSDEVSIVTDHFPDVGNFGQEMMFVDTIGYLPDDILTKVDRASMGVSLEVRVPLLDHRIVELAFKLPMKMKINKRCGKWLLRKILNKYVPAELMERPKKGFAIPLEKWLRGELRDWAESLLDETRLRREGFLNPVPIRKKWDEHLSGKNNWRYHLWNVLMFQAWLEEQ